MAVCIPYVAGIGERDGVLVGVILGDEDIDRLGVLYIDKLGVLDIDKLGVRVADILKLGVGDEGGGGSQLITGLILNNTLTESTAASLWFMVNAGT